MADTGWLSLVAVALNPIETLRPWSNISNVKYANSNYASVSLANAGTSSDMISNGLFFNIAEPIGGWPAGSTIDGVECTIYAQYRTASGQDRDVVCYNFYGPLTCTMDGGYGIAPNICSPGEGYIVEDSDASPYPDDPYTFGGPANLLGLSPGTLVQDFFDDFGYFGGQYHGYLRVAADNGPGTEEALVRVAYIRFKIYYSPPPLIDMAASPSLSVLAGGAVLQKIIDMGAAPVGSSSIAATIEVDGALQANPSFDVVIVADISLGMTYIDNTANPAFSVTLAPPTVVKMRNMSVNAAFSVTAPFPNIGNTAPLSCNMPVSVTMTPRLGNIIELQTSGVDPWFNLSIDAPPPDGTLWVDADASFTVTLNGDGMEVDWALYTNPVLAVGITADLRKYTNLYADMVGSVQIAANLVQSVDMAAAMSIGGFMLNSRFSKLPVPTLEERTLVIAPRDRTFLIPAPGRTLVLNSQQRN